MGRCGQILVRCARFVVLVLLCGRPVESACGLGVQASDADLWYTITLQGERAGWMRSRERTDTDRITTEVEWRLTVSRAGTPVESRKQGRFIETPDGKPISFWSMQNLGSAPREVQYDFRPDGIDVKTTEAGRITTSTLALPAGDWLTPRQAGEFITTRLLSGADRFSLTSIDILGDIHPATTQRELLERDTTIEASGKKVHATKWKTVLSSMPDLAATEFFDPLGVLVRSEVDLGGVSIVTLLSDERTAKRTGVGPEMMLQTFIRPSQPIARPSRLKKAVFDLSVADGELPDIPAGAAQTVTRPEGDALRARMTIDINARVQVDIDPADYLKPSNLINSDDEPVQELARRAVRRASKDPARRAEAIRNFVNHYIRSKSLGVGLASAAEVARHGEGDCTEHAVLSAAMLRASDIPSRIATGLVLVDEFAGQKSIFGYHMWTQALIDGCWVDFDAALPQRFDATHIALSFSTSNDDDFLAQMTRLLPLMGRLKIDVVDVEY